MVIDDFDMVYRTFRHTNERNDITRNIGLSWADRVAQFCKSNLESIESSGHASFKRIQSDKANPQVLMQI